LCSAYKSHAANDVILSHENVKKRGGYEIRKAPKSYERHFSELNLFRFRTFSFCFVFRTLLPFADLLAPHRVVESFFHEQFIMLAGFDDVAAL
jgi:hypothetical protein